MWYKIINAVSIITIMIGLGQAALPPDGWRDTMVICNGDNIDSEGRIASGGRDVLHQAWIRGGSFTREIYYQQSLDNGYKWGNRCQISNAGALAQEVLDYALAADPNGNVYCVWSQYWYDPTFHVRLWWSYSHNNGITWSNPVDITDDIELPTESVRDMQPSLSIDNQGRLHLAFFYAQAIDPHHEWLYVRYSYYPDSIGGWAHYETIDDFGLHGSNYYYPYPSITTIGTVPHVVYAQNEGADENPRYVYVWHSVRISQNNWQRSEIAYYGGYTRVYGTDLTISPNGNLHALWTRKFVKAAYNIHYARSLDGGTVWQDYKVLQEDLELGGLIGADAKGVHVISSNTYDLFYHYSIDGSEWQNPQVILQNSNPSIKHFINDIVANYSGRSVVFENGYGGDDASVGYFANDDTLLSDNSEATAYNWGRHLVRDPFTNRLHLVYFSQNRPHYTYSDDEGRTWAPYHIIENFDFTGKDRGRYPSIGLFVTPTDALNPCVAYISPTSSGDTLKYRWWDAAINQWQGFWLYNDNLFYSAPSITVAGEMVNLVVVVRDYLTSQYGVIYYEFPYYATGPGLPEVIEQGMMDIYNSPCITIDGNWDKHVVYEKSGDVIYMRRFGPNDWRPDRPFPSTPEESVTPFIEAYGDHLYVPYAEADPTTGCYDIFRRWRRIQPPGNWLIHPEEISKSPGIPSECPVSAWSDFTVWAEQGDGDIEFDLKYYWHPENRSGFISTAPVNDYYPHSQMYYDWLGGSTVLLTAWTKGLMTTPPYRIAFQKMGFLPPPDGFGTYYPVITGNKEPSFFCTKRDTFIRYQRYNVDYGKNELIYTLTLLNPVYPAYKVKVLSYFEGTGNRSEKVLVDGREFATLNLKSNQLNTSEILITREYYKKDHRAVVSFQGADGVSKAGLVVYQLEKVTSGGYAGGGSQSAETGSSLSTDEFEIRPNPAKGGAMITFLLKNRASVQLKLYNASGQLIQDIVNGITDKGIHQFSLKKGLPAGVYFVTFEVNKKKITEKVTIIR